MSEFTRETDTVGARHLPIEGDDRSARNSAVSWGAILAGAVGAAILSLLMFILGTGLGLSAVSPWTLDGISASTFGFGAIVWLSFTQLAASGMGGYLAGRLRTKWTAVHNDEVFFRDTAHGFLTWAVATLLTVLLMTSVVGSIVGGGLSAAGKAAGGAASVVGNVAGTATESAATLASGNIGSSEADSTIEYFVDSLFRGDARSAASDAGRQTREVASEIAEIPVGEVTRIFVRALRTGALPQEDERYIARLIAQRTDLSMQEAERRVADGFERARTTLEEAETTAREVADEARKASAYAALWVVVALLLGALTASFMAVFGGRQRDE